MPDDIAAHDARRRRCPMLGHDVPFAYCRAPGADLPCRKIFDCWWEALDVASFIGAHFSEQQIAEALAPRPDKMVALLELIERSRRRSADR